MGNKFSLFNEIIVDNFAAVCGSIGKNESTRIMYSGTAAQSNGIKTRPANASLKYVLIEKYYWSFLSSSLLSMRFMAGCDTSLEDCGLLNNILVHQRPDIPTNEYTMRLSNDCCPPKIAATKSN